jgi:ADP-dependent NAD(P)H-hydrate dehydratase / NAD(P)H-hydrate epimerase
MHGLAGDLVAMEQGEIGMTASDLTARIPLALNRLLNRPKPTNINAFNARSDR